MSRRCMVTGKGVMTGYNVSHAKNRTKRRFLPNVQYTSVYSEKLKRWVKLRATPRGLKTIEHNGGIDSWLLSIAPSKLEPKLRRLRAEIEKKSAPAKAAKK